MDSTRRGKIARLPLIVREELNRRLQEGQTGKKILPWLNALEEVKQILGEDFEGLAVNDQNLSDWRKGGYQDWLRKTDTRFQRMERTKELAAMSMKLAEAGGGALAEGAASILGGSILEILEQLDDLRTNLDSESLSPGSAGVPPAGEGEAQSKLAAIGNAINDLTLAVSRLRKGDHNKEQIRQNEERLKQAREELDLAQAKFQRETVGIALKILADDRAKQIEGGSGTNEEKIELMGQHIFGDLWKSRPGSAGVSPA